MPDWFRRTGCASAGVATGRGEFSRDLTKVIIGKPPMIEVSLSPHQQAVKVIKKGKIRVNSL
ncbi:hypothetical protein ACFVSS_26175 [Peribacillus butanolivorans]|uniref:hypothetical protein n=1 Tax=Peribacillus butanolivorans TaxID=421767 RepID=UPI0036DECF97